MQRLVETSRVVKGEPHVRDFTHIPRSDILVKFSCISKHCVREVETRHLCEKDAWRRETREVAVEVEAERERERERNKKQAK